MQEQRTERQRLATLNSYGILDTPNEPEFDEIVNEAKRALGAPIALVSLIDHHRQWFKAKIGLDVAETPRCISFCTHAIHGPSVMVVPDAQDDQRFVDNPLVIGPPHIRFYAGAPLKVDNGRRVGTLCVIDTVPRIGLATWQERKLVELAARTVEAMERRAVRHAAAITGATRP
jgi:GAF domain-containing protein